MSLFACTFGFHNFILETSPFEETSNLYKNCPSYRRCKCCGLVQTKVIKIIKNHPQIHYSEYWHTDKLGKTIF